MAKLRAAETGSAAASCSWAEPLREATALRFCAVGGVLAGGVAVSVITIVTRLESRRRRWL